MTLLSYRRHRFPPEIIQYAIWLYLRFTLSYRDLEHEVRNWYPAYTSRSQ
jgi:transposase-like protein